MKTMLDMEVDVRAGPLGFPSFPFFPSSLGLNHMGSLPTSDHVNLSFGSKLDLELDAGNCLETHLGTKIPGTTHFLF